MARKPSNVVEFKGYGDDINIIINADAAFSDIEKELIKKLEDSDQFFAGIEDLTIVLDLGNLVLNVRQCERLRAILIDRYKLVISGLQIQSEKTRKSAEKIGWEFETYEPKEQKQREQQREQKRERRESGRKQIAKDSDSILLRQTIRSGQRLWNPGNIVIVGDVNPGAEVVAAGDIVVMGSLRGVAHAGAEGDASARIIALDLRPIQLRIAEYIGRAPDMKPQMDNTPEEAFVRDGSIVIHKLK